ncbi:hypothetical protein CCICO_02340 [Corynebacterium ciconiae DSM 44920]|uniref:VOC family protein n=1 Tax=Corynebacterium ciconiae TaxID=227319 RepID=UPI00036A5AE4|nr:VOC family protein [Corynebacterium ciconiae]WKD60519.1 hypothetical protein CCICO_02340 [Corynebacterium ciconiae DSM 44920]
MSSTILNRIGVVVYDLDAAVASYEKIYGISTWQRGTHAPDDGISYGRHNTETPGRWASAVGSTDTLTFELIQPLSGESPFNEHLRTKREGICFIQICLPELNDDAAIDRHFADLGIEAAYTATVDGTQRRFFDTRSQLGGFLVEMVAENNPMGGGTVDSALLPTEGIYHFGVLVHDVMASLEHYRAIFGIDRFDMKTWETGTGRLDRSQYRGELVDHGYFTAQGACANFAFEIIECNHGPSHYNREFFDIRGPGIHHVFTTMTTDSAEWDRIITTAAEAGYELCMGSPLRGHAAEFGYLDTFADLGGYLIEVVVRRHTPDPAYASPDWVIDYSTQLPQEG